MPVSRNRKSFVRPSRLFVFIFVPVALAGLLTLSGEGWKRLLPSVFAQTAGVSIKPASPTGVGNCIPFGQNTIFQFEGFIYRNIPAFSMSPGDKIRFDLGALNDVDTRRNIYFATANINPTSQNGGQNVRALSWTKVVSESQTPLNPRGDTISGNYELTYTAEAAFSFSGGGFIVAFGGTPPGTYADGGCDQVLVQTSINDASGKFYRRFYSQSDQTLGILDTLDFSKGDSVALGGIVIEHVGNTAPTANNQTVQTSEDTPANITLTGSDPEGQTLTYTVVSGPGHGSLNTNSGQNVTYTPNQNFNGSDSFTFRVNDGSLNSNTATVTINVAAINDAPVAADDSYTDTGDLTLSVAAPGVLSNDSDVDSPSLTAFLQSGPSHGTLSLNANGSFTYTPNAGFAGTDSFVYGASDGSAATPATVNITVTPPACAQPPSGLVAWYPAGGNANDVKGGNNGTLLGGAAFAAGQVGQAFSLNGTDAGVKVPAAASLNVGAGSGLTIELWFNPANLNERSMVEWNNNAGGIGAHFNSSVVSQGKTPGNLYSNLIDTNGNSHIIQSSGGLLHTNQWQHGALTYDRTTGVATIYLNGVAIAGPTNIGVFTPRTTYDLYLGDRPSGSDSGFFGGRLDEVHIYNRALSASEVQSVYSASSAGFCDSPPSVSCPAAQAVEATSPAGANADTTVQVSDPDGNSLAVTWSVDGNAVHTDTVNNTSTPQGVTLSQSFALGPHSVSASVSDGVAAAVSCSTSVTVRDTTPPVISPHPDVTAEATSAGGASVSYTTPTASDLVSGTVAVNCTPASGSTFALGTTAVHCSAQDAAGNPSTSSFNVTVRDTTPPAISNLPGGGASFDWLNVNTNGAPSARVGHRMVYDPVRHKVILFGGHAPNAPHSGNYVSATHMNDVWEFDTASRTWTNVTPATGSMPDGRSDFGMAYDIARNKVVIYGGEIDGWQTDDTWEWDPATHTWEAKPAAGSLAYGGLLGSAMAYDPNRQQVIVFGGHAYFDWGEGGTWAWNGNNWVNLAPSSAPSSRFLPAMATDTARSKVVMFGGQDPGSLNDTWEWDGSDWTQVTPSGASPSARSNAGMAYDASRHVSVLFGGGQEGTLNDAWEWDGSAWKLVHPPTTPSARATYLVYDASQSSLVFFGGSPQADTWVSQSIASITVEATGPDGATVTWPSPTATDAVDGTDPVTCAPPSGSVFPVGTTTVQCTSTDAHGNTGHASFTVKVQDTTPPTASAGGPYTVDEGSSTTVAATGADAVTNALTYEWDLDNDGIFETQGQSATFSAAALDGPSSHTIKVRVSDAAGLSATASATVSVQNVAPQVVLRHVKPPKGGFKEGSPFEEDGGFGDPGIADTWTATIDYGDGSGVVPLPLNPDNTFSFGHAYADNGDYTITVTVTDDDGGTGSASVTANIVNADPSAQDDAYTTDEDTPLTVASPGVLSNDTDPGAADIPSLAVTPVGGPSHGTLALNPNGSFAYTPAQNYNGADSFTYQTTDKDGGVSGIATVNINVNPVNDPPTADAGQDQTVECGGATTPVTLAGAGADVDNDPQTLTFTWKEGMTTLGAGQTFVANLSRGVHTITLTVTDPGGATAQDDVSVTVQDTTDPVVGAPPAINVGTGPDATSCGVTINDLGRATATDACAGPLTATASGVPAGNFFPVGTTTITYTATDAAGNTSSATQTVTVFDDTKPTVSVPADVMVTTGAGAASCSTVVGDATIGPASASDNCGVQSLVRSGVPAGNVFPVGTTTITYTATDVHGNVTKAAQRVTVVDDTPPVLYAPPPVTVGTGAGAASCTAFVGDAALGTPKANDNCGVDTSSFARAGVPAGNLFPVGTTTVTYMVRDVHGNMTTATQTVTVVDTTLPVITLKTQGITLWPPDHNYVNIKVSDLVASATDNCDAAGVNAGKVVISQVTSDEPENANAGDGNTVNDIVIGADCKSVNLRAERDGTKNGRVYTIYLQVKDSNGNVQTATVKVSVPKSQGAGGTAVDDTPPTPALPPYFVKGSCTP